MTEPTEPEKKPLTLLKDNVDAPGKVQKARDLVEEKGLAKADDTVVKLQSLLEPRKRKAIELSKERPFIQDDDLGTPGGGPVEVPVKPENAAAPSGAQSTSEVGSPIEFLHFGRIHRDSVANFPSAKPNDDLYPLEPGVIPGHALYFRGALEREAVLLAGVADSIKTALETKEKQEGNLGTLMKVAGDLLGGGPGTENTAASADMQPFVAKIEEAYKKIDKSEIRYADLHEAGIDLHKVRSNLELYLLEQVGKEGPPATKSKLSELKGLPLMGSLPLPGELGSIVKTFNEVGGKLHDAFNKMVFGLSVTMLPAIESACHAATIDHIKSAKSPIYPVWFEPLTKDAEARRREALEKTRQERGPVGALKRKDPLVSGNIGKALGGDEVHKRVDNALKDTNEAINDAAEKPLEIIDFLSTPVPKVPGHRFLDLAFQASTNDKAILGGSEKLSEVAIAAFNQACFGKVPGFMQGFVEDFVGYVFAVCVEFLRSVYRILCGLGKGGAVDTAQIVAAGTTHVLTHLLDFLTAKLGLDELIQKYDINLKDHMPVDLPGINIPDKPMSAAPIAQKLKELLVDKAKPLLAPVVEYAMSGLALRLNTRRGWAGNAITMEAHLSQLPTELALLFRDLFKPLWDFLTDTVMHIISDVVGKALGPAADVLGVGGNALGFAKDYINQARGYADQAKDFAQKAQDKADHLINELSSVTIGGDKGDEDIKDIGAAADDLMGHGKKSPFKKVETEEERKKREREEQKKKDEEAAKRGAGMFALRTSSGRGIPIEPPELEKVKPDDQWPKSLPKPGSPAEKKAAGAA